MWSAMANVKQELVDYLDVNGKTYQALVAHDQSNSNKRPAVLIFPTWAGRSEAENERAVKLAQMGYVGFAADVYGKGIAGSSPEENMRLIRPLLDDRSGELWTRVQASLNAIAKLPMVDASKIAAIGYCFGGLIVLDMARFSASSSVKPVGVVSIHGILTTPATSPEPPTKINSKVLVLHGYADPKVPPEQVVTFCAEMTERKADWQLHAYGHALHAFTSKKANDESHGIKYDADADRRSWEAMRYFLSEIFA